MQVNLPYILWITGTNTSIVLGYYALEVFFFPNRVLRLKSPSDPTGKRLLVENSSTANSTAPLMLEAINKNSLVIFLFVCLSRPPCNPTHCPF